MQDVIDKHEDIIRKKYPEIYNLLNDFPLVKDAKQFKTSIKRALLSEYLLLNTIANKLDPEKYTEAKETLNESKLFTSEELFEEFIKFFSPQDAHQISKTLHPPILEDDSMITSPLKTTKLLGKKRGIDEIKEEPSR